MFYVWENEEMDKTFNWGISKTPDWRMSEILTRGMSSDTTGEGMNNIIVKEGVKTYKLGMNKNSK